MIPTGLLVSLDETSKHGSWLALAESEPGILAAQCLDRRIPDKQSLIEEIAAWEQEPPLATGFAEIVGWTSDIGCRRSNLAVGATIVPWGCSIRLELADACSKKLIVELAKPSGLFVEKKRKECISAAQCDARNRVQQRAWKYDCAAKRRLEFSRPVFRKA